MASTVPHNIAEAATEAANAAVVRRRRDLGTIVRTRSGVVVLVVVETRIERPAARRWSSSRRTVARATVHRVEAVIAAGALGAPSYLSALRVFDPSDLVLELRHTAQGSGAAATAATAGVSYWWRL